MLLVQPALDYYGALESAFQLMMMAGKDFAGHFIGLNGLVAFIALWGLNFCFWGGVGLLRLVDEKLLHRAIRALKLSFGPQPSIISENDVAVIVPAHNEELVIANTIRSLLKLIAAQNIFIISDGSVDKTAFIARSFNVNVLELNPAQGKANALAIGIAHFALARRFKGVMLVDADTIIPSNYIRLAAPFLANPRVAAIAGYARTLWEPTRHSFAQMFFITHRERVYTLSQLLLKFGQTWRHTNVATIVPGFASIYRADLLDKIDLNPPGLVIEDFNMTFEVHHKRLGIIAHHPSISGYTQDPDNYHDYFRQVRRWDLGFWQTLFRHGFWWSWFSLALALFVFEVLVSSILFIVLPVLLAGLALSLFNPVLAPYTVSWFWATLQLTVFGLWIPDMLVSAVIGGLQKRPQYFYYAPFLIFLKFIDAIAFLGALPRALRAESTGRWVSPTRRAN